MGQDSEELARFLTSSRHYNAVQRRVLHTAFLPRHGATSVFRVAGLTDNEVKAICAEHIVMGPGRKVHGCGFLGHERITLSGLALDVDDTPPRHANIVGWPEEKGKQKLKAMELAEAALLRLWTDPQA